MPDQPVSTSQPTHIEPIFDASGTLRRVRVERPKSSDGVRQPQPAERT